MAKNSIRDFDNTSGNNTDIQSVDISEGCSPAGINNAIREMMADLADVNDGTVALTSPSADSMTVTGDLTISDKIVHSGDTNTAIRFPAADTVTIETGGNERARVASDGKIGVGITSPEALTHIAGATADADGALGSQSPQLIIEGGNNNNPFEIGMDNSGATAIAFLQSRNKSSGAQFLSLNPKGGNVGIGSVNPTNTLTLYGNKAAAYAASFHNDGNSVDRYGLLIFNGTDDNSGTNAHIQFADGDASGVGLISSSGGTVTYGAFTAMHPCVLPDADNDDGYPYGTLLETTSLAYTQKSGADTERGLIYNVRKTQSANSKSVLGAYGSSMNDLPDETNKHQALVLGDGHILCNNSGGNISVGDGICSSAVAGIGQKATANPSMIIGIAQEDVTFADDTETKLVAVQYGLQQFIPWN